MLHEYYRSATFKVWELVLLKLGCCSPVVIYYYLVFSKKHHTCLLMIDALFRILLAVVVVRNSLMFSFGSHIRDVFCLRCHTCLVISVPPQALDLQQLVSSTCENTMLILCSSKTGVKYGSQVWDWILDRIDERSTDGRKEGEISVFVTML